MSMRHSQTSSTSKTARIISHPTYQNTTGFVAHSPGQLTFLQWNCNGIKNKTDELQQHLETHKIHIAETKLNSRSKEPEFDGYSIYRKDRGLGQGGGLVMLIHNNIPYSIKQLPDSNPIESQAIILNINYLGSVVAVVPVYAAITLPPQGTSLDDSPRPMSTEHKHTNFVQSTTSYFLILLMLHSKNSFKVKEICYKRWFCTRFNIFLVCSEAAFVGHWLSAYNANTDAPTLWLFAKTFS
ncbi:hypothetical protein HELRODRAFT_165002 [Helobdella robusta]|uniref:Uncharacterized protein n=1 Tax=Helobdella robusta TaxID=6412 RepID=T1EW37_HELRO|nr:hypothetical protein HELRODRAFT_165002 [Helobdella robusta]ESN92868.1 hypothetical protein HELRODRAFT_165002 [Helobdella robusta]